VWARGWVLVAVLASMGFMVAPAAGHEADPRLETTVDEVVPPLPAAVVVQAQAGLAAQLVVDNPTPTVLEVLATGGEPFLRISSAGVQANLSSPDFFTTSNPTGATAGVPDAATSPRWVQISTGSSWGWYDHRLHPPGLGPPPDAERPARLAGWVVPLRYGDQPVEVRGSVRFQPLLGTFLVTADPAPDGLLVQALPGKLPGLFLSNPQRLPVTVLGRDGEPFVRFTERGVEVNVASRTHVEDRQARGVPVGPPEPTPRFELVEPGGTSYTWLDARLRYPQELPPPDVLMADRPTVVDDWQVPVLRDGQQGELTGEIRWVPQAAAAPPSAAAPGGTADEPRSVTAPLALGLAGLAALAAGVLAVRRRAR
jgi:hypothetical protein